MNDSKSSRKFLMEQSFSALFALANKAQMKADKCLSLLTSRQLMAMIAIVHLPSGQATLKNVAAKLGNSMPSTSHIIAGLAKKGYLITVANPNDGRSINYVITDKGKNAMITDGREGYAFFDRFFRDFSDAELSALWTLLRKLYRYDGIEHDGFDKDEHLKDNQQHGHPTT
jgi:DNA-binding MarR family transcriptional regulator